MKEKIFEVVMSNIKNPKMYALLLALIVVFFLLFPYLDANIFYYKRINDRVDILTKVAALDEDSFADNPVLRDEYERILNEVSNQPESMVSNILTRETSKNAAIAKFITGGLLFWIIAFCCFVIKGFKNIGYKIFGFMLFAVIGIVFGFIAKSMPNIFSPWVNCVGFPFIQCVFVALILTSNKKSTDTHKEKQT